MDVNTNKRIKLAIYTDSAQAHAGLLKEFPQVQTHIETDVQGFEIAARDAEVVFISRKYTKDMVLGLSQMKWLHLGGTGVDRLQPLSDLPPDVTITHTPSLNAEMMADYVICVILMLTWDFPRILRNQQRAHWEKWGVERIEGKRLGLVGLGRVGQAVARRATAMRMAVAGIKRSPHVVPYVQRVLGRGALDTLLTSADFLVLTVPLTAATQGMIGPRELQAMKKTAYLVNVCRGAVVQQDALIHALKNGWIAGAALDVFEDEPLPADSELWNLENVIISPHVSSWSADYRVRANRFFCRNLRRYLAGEPLLEQVDRSKGY